jgi:ABC-2 type transport system permease protein
MWNVALKDIKVYYLTPPMIMFGLMMPFFMFFSFSVKREMAAAQGVARLLAAPMSLIALLLGKSLVGTFFALAVSTVPLLVGLLWLQVAVANVGLLVIGLVASSMAFSTFGLAFASIPTRSVGSIMMPSTLIRWPLLFVSGVFIPLEEMVTWMRPAAYVSPLTYAQDLMNHIILGQGLLNPWLDMFALLLSGAVSLWVAVRMHRRARK